MAYHEIAGMVEDALLLIHQSGRSKDQKSKLIHRIIAIQKMFDTDGFSKEVTDILRDYPAKKTSNADNVVVTIRELLEMIADQKDLKLLSKWYSFLVNGWLELDFDETNGIPKSFLSMTTDPILLRIRTYLTHCKSSSKKSTQEDEPDYSLLPSLKKELELAKGIDSVFGVRFFLDKKSTVDELVREYKNTSAKKGEVGSVEELVEEFIGSYLKGSDWKSISSTKKDQWIWYHELKEPSYSVSHRFFLELEWDREEEVMNLTQAVQHALILRWQEKTADENPYHWHFYRPINASLPPGFFKSHKLKHFLGGWKVSDGDAVETQKKVFENLLKAIKDYGTVFEKFILEEFPDKFLLHSPDQLIDWIENGQEGSGIIPEEVLFANVYFIPLAFAFAALDKGDAKTARQFFSKIKSMAESRQSGPLLMSKIIQPFLLSMETKKKPKFPLVWHMKLLNYFKETSS